jgi:hypothetical protein
MRLEMRTLTGAALIGVAAVAAWSIGGGCLGECVASHQCPCPDGQYGTSVCNVDGSSACNCCRHPGMPCDADHPCCSGACLGGVCQTQACLAFGMACTADTECCSGTQCCNGVCGQPGCCAPQFTPCTAAGQCCSGYDCVAGWHHDGFTEVPACVLTALPDCQLGSQASAAVCSYDYCTDSRVRAITCEDVDGEIVCACVVDGVTEATFTPISGDAGGAGGSGGSGGSGGDAAGAGGSGASGGGVVPVLDCRSLDDFCSFNTL